MSTPTLHEQLRYAHQQLELLKENMAKLELSRDNAGWEKITNEAAKDFTREGRRKAATQARVLSVANPLIKRGLAIRAAYVFGQGVGTTANGEDVNHVVQAFLDDPETRKVLTGAQAQEVNERTLGTDGNLFFALFTDRRTGQVTPRTIDFDEISDIITAPGDKDTVHYYLREWTETTTNGNQTTHRAYYPELWYHPPARQRHINNVEVMWDTPVYHMRVNHLLGQKFGVGDAYAALPWAAYYKTFLEDWARLVQALSKIAFQFQEASGSKATAAARQAMQDFGGLPAGSNVASNGRWEAVPKTGATIDSESGRPLAAMVASALELPVVTLMGDPGVSGTRAVAETLNLPTRLAMEARQELWRETRRQIISYVVLQAVLAPQGPLKGTVKRVRDRLIPVLPKPEDATLTITFPEIDEKSVTDSVNAIVAAHSTQTVPPAKTLELLLRALRVRDVDEILAQVTDENGEFVDPNAKAGATAAKAALDALRRGEDPAKYL